jgi:hypothetical protein
MFKTIQKTAVILTAVFLLALILCLSFNHPPETYKAYFTSSEIMGGVKLLGFNLSLILFFILNYFFVALFGYILTRLFWKDIDASFIVKLWAGFLMGYVCVLGIARVMSLIFPLHYFYWPTIVMMAAFMFMCYGKQKEKIVFSSTKMGREALSLLILIALLCFVLLFQIRQDIGEFLWVGHGQTQYAYMHDRFLSPQWTHFPIIKQHYDELLFHEFFFGSLLREFDPIVIWWVTLGLIKISSGAFFFLLFRKLNVAVWMAIVFSLFICLGSTSFTAINYYMLFDSGNPVWLAAHSGRVVGIGILYLLLMSVFFHEKEEKLPTIFIVLCSLGITATSISNFLLIIMLYILAIVFFPVLKDRLDKGIYKPTSADWLCYAIVGTCLLWFALPFYGYYTIRLIALVAVILLFMLRLFPYLIDFARIKGETKRRLIKRLTVFFVTCVLSLLFLGNIAVENKMTKSIQSFLNKKGYAIDIMLLKDQKGKQFYPEKGTWKIGDYREIGRYNAHCISAGSFAAYYGGLLGMILLVNYLFGRRIKENRPNLLECYTYELFLGAAVLLVCFLFFMNFVDYGSRAWLKSRFLELPVYFIVFTFLFFVSRFKPLLRNIVAIVLLIYTLTPFTATGRPHQIRENWRIFVDLMRS